MKSDVRLMLQIYQTKDKDWMGYEISKNNVITRHHIFKRVYGGDNDISNYALLIVKSHQYLHTLEKTDHEIYLQLNQLFRELNESMKPPTEEYYQRVDKVLKRVRNKK